MTPPLRPDEDLGRGVFSRRQRDRARNGRIDMNVFLEREEAVSISVDRMAHAPPDELAEWCRQRGRSRARECHGWAVLTTGDAEKNGRTVTATPTPENRCHADIFLNVSGDERRRQQKQHAIELTAHSSWLENALDRTP